MFKEELMIPQENLKKVEITVEKYEKSDGVYEKTTDCKIITDGTPVPLEILVAGDSKLEDTPSEKIVLTSEEENGDNLILIAKETNDAY
jgi:hypothetical protein